MDNWKSILNTNPIPWLLEDNNPSVKYFTLIDVLEKAENDPEVIKTKDEIMINRQGIEVLFATLGSENN